MKQHKGMPILERSCTEAFSEWVHSARTSGAFLLLDKPKGWTSFDAVAFVRARLRRRTGHAGTLDPIATGLLILGLGAATKVLGDFQQLPKTYRATLKLGATTDTDDAEAPERIVCPEVTVTEEEIRRQLERFRGTLRQIPPRYAAIKHQGKRLYELARAGIAVQPPARTVTISQLELHSFTPPLLELSLVCSAGTYVRALARDLGEALGCGAYVLELRRCAIGPYRVEDALTPQEFAHWIDSYARLHPAL